MSNHFFYSFIITRILRSPRLTRNGKHWDNPSNKAGRGATNQPTGDKKTRLDSIRRDEDLTGIAGDGPSERETLSSTATRQDAARSYRERYATYRKQMEAALDREPLPLGHRETVRKYFESIRPTNEQIDLVDPIDKRR